MRKILIGVFAAICTAIFVAFMIPRPSGRIPVSAVLSQAPASTRHATAARTVPHRAAVPAAAGRTTAELMLYTVLKGDSLSTVAARTYGTSRDWPLVWWNNRAGIPNPDQLPAGMVLKLGGLGVVTSMTPAIEAAARAALPKPPPPAPASAGVGGSSSGGGSAASSAPPVPAAQVSTSGMGSFQACVIQRESGGNPNIWNASGHWGLYQFSASTWAAHGGDPGLFGNATASYQTMIFWNTVRADGTADWAPYDGC